MVEISGDFLTDGEPCKLDCSINYQIVHLSNSLNRKVKGMLMLLGDLEFSGSNFHKI